MSEKKCIVSAEMRTIIDTIYPVGSYFWSSEDKDPSTFLGGTWEQVKDKFLLAAGDSYAVGSTGGEATHTLTVDEMPTHGHSEFLNITGIGRVTIGGGSTSGTEFYEILQSASQGRASGGPTNTGYAGGRAAHNNMPPYITAHCWHRTA